MVAECNESGLSRKEFAKRKGLNPSTLQWWVSELDRPAGRRRRRKPEEEIRALPVTVIDDAGRTVGEGIEVAFGDLKMVFPAGTDAVYLGELFLELRSIC